MRQRLACVGVLGILMSGCSGMTINNDYDREADFSSYRTYAWHAGEHSVKDDDPLAHERIMQAVDRQMASNRLEKVSQNPDVFITYNSEETEEMNLTTTYMGGGWGMGPGWGWGRPGMRGGMGMGMGMGGAGMGASTTNVRKYNIGTLVLDMWDVDQHRLVWRGIASDTLSTDPQKNSKKIDKAAQKLFERFPPT